MWVNGVVSEYTKMELEWGGVRVNVFYLCWVGEFVKWSENEWKLICVNLKMWVL